MDHFRYCVDLVGIEHVAFGPDTLYGDHVQLHRSSPTCSASRRCPQASRSSRSPTSTGWRTRPRASATSAAGSCSTDSRRRHTRGDRRERLPRAAVDLGRLGPGRPASTRKSPTAASSGELRIALVRTFERRRSRRDGLILLVCTSRDMPVPMSAQPMPRGRLRAFFHQALPDLGQPGRHGLRGTPAAARPDPRPPPGPGAARRTRCIPPSSRRRRVPATISASPAGPGSSRRRELQERLTHPAGQDHRGALSTASLVRRGPRVALGRVLSPWSGTAWP